MKVQWLVLSAVLALGLAGCREQAAVPAAPSPTAPAPSLTQTPLPTQPPVSSPTALPADTPSPSCIAGGDQTTINARLRHPGDTAVLCPGALIELSGTVQFSAPDQQIYTEGYPTGDQRAVLRIVSPDVSTAIVMRDFDNALLSHVVVDGNRPALGYRAGDALIYAGGASSGQVVQWVKITEPRSWSALHFIEGHPAPGLPCSNALIENNEIGPAGSSSETWADGISLACTHSIVRSNQIVDATDGGIVVFGAPGSIIENNTIRAETRTLLGGINMVDYHPYEGSYAGTVVRNNIIDAGGAVIRIGLGMGTRVWVCLPLNTDKDTLSGGTVTGNILRGEKMQYGFAVDGVADWTVLDNRSEAAHSGQPTVDCRGQVASPPSAFLFYPPRAQGAFQSEFVEGRLELALWAIR